MHMSESSLHVEETAGSAEWAERGSVGCSLVKGWVSHAEGRVNAMIRRDIRFLSAWLSLVHLHLFHDKEKGLAARIYQGERDLFSFLASASHQLCESGRVTWLHCPASHLAGIW